MNGIYLVSVAFLNFKKFQSLKFVANDSLAMQFLSVLESSIALVLRNCAAIILGKDTINKSLQNFRDAYH